MNERKLNVLTLALGIALLPPIWAVISPYFGITTGSVALICAGIFVANGNKVEDEVKISIGFFLGDLWGCIGLKAMDMVKLNENIELFCALFILGGLAVIIASTKLEKIIFLPAWLAGWAITLLIMAPLNMNWGTLPVQILISMLMGVWYVGVGVLKFQNFLIALIKK
ncbi:DUF1097 domain-containing protein [Clostridium sp. P21]|uniref:DUF1097 domain-containing protein n=1 Tax=Clostridium muellerianum TaxID=2716538 RepID=A0A7Y0EJF7_9CLOT|nr:DUF1097 domain-containing protein [Clostridium muellerianum]NMM64603.1 DUF1097 domain-containing protein [Clostridium muellerianum]